MIIETIQANPRISIVVIALLVSFFISLTNYFILDKDKLRASKVRQKELQKQIKENKHDPAKTMALNKEYMEHTFGGMKHTFKPMLVTIIPTLIIFSWIKGVFSETVISGSWFWWYLVFAMVGSIIFRKIFKLP